MHLSTARNWPRSSTCQNLICNMVSILASPWHHIGNQSLPPVSKPDKRLCPATGFYISIVTGAAILTNRLYRARALTKYLEAKLDNAPELQLQHWADMANVEPWRLPYASHHAARLRVEGVLAAIGVPLLWALPWRITGKDM